MNNLTAYQQSLFCVEHNGPFRVLGTVPISQIVTQDKTPLKDWEVRFGSGRILILPSESVTCQSIGKSLRVEKEIPS